MNFVISGLDLLDDLKNKNKQTKKHRSDEPILLLMLWRGILTPRPVSPAGKVHLVTPKVNVAIGEDFADLLKELHHECVGGVKNGVHRSKGARGLRCRVTGCEQIWLA